MQFKLQSQHIGSICCEIHKQGGIYVTKASMKGLTFSGFEGCFFWLSLCISEGEP